MEKELSRQEPYRDLLGLRDTINGVFGDFFSGRPLSRFTQNDDGFGWTPAVNIRETDEEIIVQAALPGVGKDDLSLEVRDNALVLSGKRKETAEENWLRHELPSGPFYRAFGLSSQVKVNQVKAAFKDGVLEIRLPKAEEAKPRKVQIQ